MNKLDMNNPLDNIESTYKNPILKSANWKNEFLTNHDVASIINSIKNTPNALSCCPHCNSNSIIKNGKNRLLKQRYKCKNCGKIFCSSTGSPLYHSKKPLAYWINYLNCMNNCFTIRKSAKEVGIHKNTSFYWRHKILHSLSSLLPVKLNGLIEIDETYFDENLKSNCSKYNLYNILNCGKPRNKVCVLSCVDENGIIFSKTACLNSPNYSIINSLLSNKIPKNSVLCTKNHYKYESFAKIHKLEIHKIARISFNPLSKFNLSKVRSFESALHNLIYSFRGVATKYMDFYITWNKWNFINSRKTLLQIIKSTLYDIILYGSNIKIRNFKFICSIN
ncbi:IS1595 family transposase [Clostridium sp. 19966]|uniref:IS1595 family transposase n=1 Tax=Clostridium sp. 19966 TaxID=2768166 RepID=UPI0028DF3F70|nr:IS1595 family transposase [Clostridium sp. 19966]MDT8716100.1 IS1595 family transposase [Clostridium sp. 19966]